MAQRLENISNTNQALSQAQSLQLPVSQQSQPVRLTNITQRRGTEIESVPSGPLSQLSQDVRDLEIRNTAKSFLDPATRITRQSVQDADVFTLLEAVNQAKLFKDKKRRNIAFGELKRRKIPNDFIQAFTEIDDPKGFLASAKGEIPETIGGIVGGDIGAFAGRGSPESKRMGAIAGAGIGAGITELGREVFERLFRPERARGGIELATDTAFTAGTEALGEGFGRFAIDPLAAKFFRPAAGSVIPGAPKISRELAQAGRQVAEEGGASPLLGTKLPIQTGAISRGVGKLGLTPVSVTADLLPSQQSASRVVSTLEGITEEAFFGGGKIARTREIVQPAALPKFISNKVDEITGGLDILSLDEIGILAQDAIHGSKVSGQKTRGASGAFNTVRREIFSDVTNRITEPIDISNAQKIAQGILDDASKGGKRLKLPEKTESILNKIVSTGNIKDMQDLIFTRSDIGDLVRAAELADEPKAKQVLAPIMKELTDSMNKAAGEAGPGVAADLKRALFFSSEGKKRFGSNLIRKMIVVHLVMGSLLCHVRQYLTVLR